MANTVAAERRQAVLYMDHRQRRTCGQLEQLSGGAASRTMWLHAFFIRAKSCPRRAPVDERSLRAGETRGPPERSSGLRGRSPLLVNLELLTCSLAAESAAYQQHWRGEEDLQECQDCLTPKGESELKIVPAGPGELESLTTLFEQYRAFYKQVPDAALARRFLAQRLERGDSTIFLARVADVAVGFVQLYPLLDSLKLGNLWLLNDLYVDPPHRGRGYSKQLLTRGMELARATNASGILLETQKTNAIGNKLYPSMGWKFDDEFNYYFWPSDTFSPAAGKTGLLIGSSHG